MKARTIFGVCVLAFVALAFGVCCCDLDASELLTQCSLAGVGIVATKAELLQQRSAENDKANEILNRAKTDGDRDFTSDEERDFDAACDRRDGLDKDLQKLDARMARHARASAAAPKMEPARAVELQQRGMELDPVLYPDPNKYSLLRAIDLRASGKPVDGYEGEVSQEISKRSEKDPSGFFMPLTLPMRSLNGRQPERRDFDTTAGTGGIPTILSGTMIDALRNKLVMTRMGAMLLTGMVGDFAIPKLTGTGTAYWVAEGNAPTESNQTIGQVTFTPKTLGAFTDITRKLIKQNSLDSEAIVQNDLLQVLRLELDRVGLNGSGSGAEPQGIMQNSSCPTVALGTNGLAPTWDMIVDLESGVGGANADADTCAYVTSAVGRGKLKKTLHTNSTAADYLWPVNSKELNGYQAFASNQVPSNLTKGSGTSLTATIFGDFAQAVYAMWGAVDVLVDPYTASSSGTVRVVLLQDTAFKLRNAVAFNKCVDIIRT